MLDANRVSAPDLLATAQSWLARDGSLVRATIIDTWGSAPVPVGGQMIVASDTRFEGSVSGGCVEGEVITEAVGLLEDGVSTPKTLEYGVEDETAWRVGLPCGGRIRILLEPLRVAEDAASIARSLKARKARKALVIATDVTSGERRIHARDDANLPPDVAARFISGASGLSPDGRMFLHALLPPPRVLVIGGTHMAQALVAMLRIIGYDTVVIDPRTAFATSARFPEATLVTDWPQDALPRLGLDPYTAVATLSHVGHIDDEALKLAVKSPCFYVGALGSRRNHAKRVERLAAAGLTPEEIARIRCPIGLDIGAASPTEIAASVLAEIIAHLRGPKRSVS
jgi:xanthine dehydrogenase accessory factor